MSSIGRGGSWLEPDCGTVIKPPILLLQLLMRYKAQVAASTQHG
jgi:hypothetical protein